MGKKTKLISLHVSSYADAFKKLSNNLFFIIAFHFAFKVTGCFFVEIFLTMKNLANFLCISLFVLLTQV